MDPPPLAFTLSSDGRLLPWTIALAVAASLLSIGIFVYVSSRRTNRRNLQIMQQLADATTEGIVVARNGRVVSVNQGIAELCGLARSELIGKGVIGGLIDRPIAASGEALLQTASGVAVPVNVALKRLSTAGDV